MACERPLSILNPRYKDTFIREMWLKYYKENFGISELPDKYISVPCGKCYSCLRSKLNGWRIRLKSEYERYPNSVFITLTFNDDCLRRFEENYNKSVRLFLDRLRKKYGKGIKHFVVAEYGSKTNRFHYHGILFNMPGKINVDDLTSLWSYGWCYLGYCNEKTINYIVKYITKDGNKNVKKDIPRLIVSKGIGEKFVAENGQYMKETLKTYIVTEKGYKVPLPKYIVDKCLDDYDKILLRIQKYYSPKCYYLNGKKYDNYAEYKVALLEFAKTQVDKGISVLPEVKRYSEICSIKEKNINPFDPNGVDEPQKDVLFEDSYSYFGVDNIPF